MNRRLLNRFALLLPLVLWAVQSGPSAAQGNAGQAITFVVPSAAGGSPDVLSRIITNQWSQNAHRPRDCRKQAWSSRQYRHGAGDQGE